MVMWLQPEKVKEPVFKVLGATGSGNFGHAGRVGEVGGSASGDPRLSISFDEKSKTWMDAKGRPAPPHVAKLSIPPAWKNVVYDPNPKSDKVVMGTDSKGREIRIYSNNYRVMRAEQKFARVKELVSKLDTVVSQNKTNLKNPEKNEAASALAVIASTGIRPGSETDTKAEKQAYGATTLEGRHVVQKSGEVRLQFTGKKGVSLDIPVRDPAVAKLLIQRKKAAGSSGKLFNVDAKALLEYTKTLDGGGFKTKDFRTALGTKTAMEEMTRFPTPKTDKEYRKSVMAVAKVVSEKLGNTPVIALQSYIAPAVFSKWQTK